MLRSTTILLIAMLFITAGGQAGDSPLSTVASGQTRGEALPLIPCNSPPPFMEAPYPATNEIQSARSPADLGEVSFPNDEQLLRGALTSLPNTIAGHQRLQFIENQYAFGVEYQETGRSKGEDSSSLEIYISEVDQPQSVDYPWDRFQLFVGETIQRDQDVFWVERERQQSGTTSCHPITVLSWLPAQGHWYFTAIVNRHEDLEPLVTAFIEAIESSPSPVPQLPGTSANAAPTAPCPAAPPISTSPSPSLPTPTVDPELVREGIAPAGLSTITLPNDHERMRGIFAALPQQIGEYQRQPSIDMNDPHSLLVEYQRPDNPGSFLLPSLAAHGWSDGYPLSLGQIPAPHPDYWRRDGRLFYAFHDPRKLQPLDEQHEDCQDESMVELTFIMSGHPWTFFAYARTQEELERLLAAFVEAVKASPAPIPYVAPTSGPSIPIYPPPQDTLPLSTPTAMPATDP